MPQIFQTAQPPDRARRRALMTEFFMRHDGPWKEEALLSFRAFHTKGGDRIFPPVPASVKFAESLFRRVEEASAQTRCSLGGFRKPGIYFIPGQELLHSVNYVGFVLFNRDGFSPFVVGPEEMLLQSGKIPSIFKYDIRTDLGAIFAGAITPESFF